MEAKNTKGYICYDVEYRTVWYVDAQGGLCRASDGNVIDASAGYVIGRWEGPAWQVADRLLMLRKFAGSEMRSELDAYLAANHAGALQPELVA